MIITRTPFRITLGGGGTDLPSFYEHHGGFVFSMGINKYMLILLHRLPVTERKFIIRYNQVEYVSTPEEIRHPLAREAFLLHGIREYMELTSIADLPARTGLGSSSSYLVGLLTAIRAYKDEPALPIEIAEEACHIELNILREPIGKQDQYMAALGGFQTLQIEPSGKVHAERVTMDFATVNELVHKARIYYTGIQRSATSVLRDQDNAAKDPGSEDHERVVDSLCHIKELGYRIHKAFLDRDLDAFGVLMHKHWQAKRQLSANVMVSALETLYDRTRSEYGVLGGKIIGAGGGGFLMLYCPHKGKELDEFMARQDMPRISYFPAMQGSRVISDMTALDDYDSQCPITGRSVSSASNRNPDGGTISRESTGCR
jgi:D-glycero-alpha-D-manno-heptose-7-phosphate kinase